MGAEQDIVAAVTSNDPGKVRDLLDRNPGLVGVTTAEGSLVLTARYHGAEDALTVLLERHPASRLSLHEAAAVGSSDRVREILTAHPDEIDIANHQGFTPLGLASFFGHPQTVEVLLENGADVNCVDASRFANAALDAAVAGNHPDVVRILLAAGADVNVRSRGGYTPLHKAVLSGNTGLARLLLEHGADPHATREGGRTPLDDARESGRGAVVQALREHGADI